MIKIQKIIAIIAVTSLLMGTYGPGVALALPEQPSKPSLPSEPEKPDKPLLPGQTATPKPTAAPTTGPAATPAPTDTTTKSTTEPSASPLPSTSPIPATTTTGTQTGGQTEADGSGSVDLKTGDATTTGSLNNNLNTNVTTTGTNSGSTGPTIINEGNGTGSQNGAYVTSDSSNTTNQDNSAKVVNNVNLDSKSGGNTVKDNTMGDVSIETGNSNTSATVVNSVNTNIAAADVAEFNVVDDHVGDIVLDFSNPCGSGACVAGTPYYLANIGNGSDSVNQASFDTDTTNETFQSNIADIENNIILTSDSGRNVAKDNTMGNVDIVTGDANVSANVVNFANNNFAGNVLVGIVNIFGELIGDIILPEGAFAPDQAYVGNVNNGAGSVNFSQVDASSADYITQQNSANITNDLMIGATTGGNQARDNTLSDSNIKTGEANVTAEILNIANSNIIGGDWWIVIVQEAGNWVGRILGAPEGAKFAGSVGTEFTVGENGALTATNSSNMAGTENQVNANSSVTNTTVQQNQANIHNNLILNANTGGNRAKDNTGGDSTITTGDADVMANIVNFVNNNFIGGRVYLTIVNVFGSWVGDFVTPGSQKEEKVADSGNSESNNPGVGGPSGENKHEVASVITQKSSDQDSYYSRTQSLDLALTGGSVLSANVGGVPQTYTSYTMADTDESGGQTALAAADTSASPEAEKMMRINIAWLIIAAPLYTAFALAKKYGLVTQLAKIKNVIL